MSCCAFSNDTLAEKDLRDNSLYESVEDVSDYYNVKKRQSENAILTVVDLKKIIENIPRDIFDIFSFTINVFADEEKILSSCEVYNIRSNIIIKPYFPLSTSITFQGVINGLSFKTSNQTIIPLNEDYFRVRIQNFNTSTQTIPRNMPLGKIVITSKQYWEI